MWDELALFVAVVERGSFRGAAAERGVARSSVSRAVRALEERVGARLLHRTTRQVAPTGPGQALYERVAPLYAALSRAVEAIDESTTEPAGLLRVTSTADYASVVLSEVVARCVTRWPRLRVEMLLTNRMVDLAAEGVDLGLRTAIAGLRGPGPAQAVGSLSLRAYAAPSYLERRGAPRTPDELGEHDLVLVTGAAPEGLVPRVVSDDAQFVRATLCAGAGVGVLPSFLAAPELVSGRLVQVLPEWSMVTGRVWLVLAGAEPPPKVIAFREALLEVLADRGELG